MCAAYYRYSGSYSQPTKAELMAKGKKYIEAQRKKGVLMEPVHIEGRTIARSWWGKNWCDNLERYSSLYNRLERGRRYILSDTVLDLKITDGTCKAVVQGSRKTPYKVEVTIDPLDGKKAEAISKQCGKKLENVEDLLSGKFPDAMKDIFYQKDGLFPSNRQIHFDCSCPDSAYLCKHVAAVLYGIGARFDQDPLLFFTLRGIDTNAFIDETLANKVECLLKNADQKSDRILDDGDDLSLFGL